MLCQVENKSSFMRQPFQENVNIPSKKTVNLFRLYSQPFSGYLVNFFRMDEFIWGKKRAFFSKITVIHGVPWKMRVLCWILQWNRGIMTHQE